MTSHDSAPVSLVIRAKNESLWLWKCLESIQNQRFKPNEIILVDNQSSDNTVEIAQRAGVDKILEISDYTPGKALNAAFQGASNELIAIISAHCVPATPHWIENLTASITQRADIAAAYGRQLPLPFSDDRDKGDLYAVFRSESRIQEKDGFLNNANSIIRRSVWLLNPFDEEVTNVEDRVWGSEVIARGFKIAYDAEATVYHHNGMHRSGYRADQTPTVRVIESRVESSTKDMPEAYLRLYDEKIVPLLVSNSTSPSTLIDEIRSLDGALTGSVWLPRIVISDIGEDVGENVCHRSDLGLSPGSSIGELLIAASRKASELWPHSRFLALFISSMGIPLAADVKSLVSALVENNSDSVFFGERDFGHIWFRDQSGDITQLDASLSLRGERRETFRVVYGRGSIFTLNHCAAGDPFAGKQSIVEISGK